MRGRAARSVRWLGIVAAIAIPTGATAFLATAPAGATDPTAQVTFTATGVNQQNLAIKPGTKVVFTNKVDPAVLGLLHSVSVKITGATQHDFTVKPDQSVTVSGYNSGSQPFVIHYTATYEAKTALLIDTTDGSYPGKITVAASQPSSPQPSTQPTTPPPSSAKPSDPPTQQPTGHPSSAPSTGQSSASDPESTIPDYRRPGPDVASQVVPKGNGGTYTPDATTNSSTGTSSSSSASTQHRTATTRAHESSAKRPTSERTTDVVAGDPVTRPAARNSANEQALDTAANENGALPTDFNWPAIAAVGLLSTVAVALVRTFAAHRRG